MPGRCRAAGAWKAACMGDHFGEPRRRPSVRKPRESEWEGAHSNRKSLTGSEVECSGRRVFGTLCTVLPGYFGFAPSVSRAPAEGHCIGDVGILSMAETSAVALAGAWQVGLGPAKLS